MLRSFQCLHWKKRIVKIHYVSFHFKKVLKRTNLIEGKNVNCKKKSMNLKSLLKVDEINKHLYGMMREWGERHRERDKEQILKL